MHLMGTATAAGFDPARLRFGLRTALGASLALLVAWGLGLEHPQWAAMTVWAASQPTPGSLVEKSLFRALGTVAGSVVGVLLVIASGGESWPLVIGLSLWVGLCAGAGNVLRGFVSYGALLAGYSASLVALVDTAHPDHIVATGLDRMETMLVGVAVALGVGLASRRLVKDGLVDQARFITATALRALAAAHSPATRSAGYDGDTRRVLSEIARVEEGLDPHGAGSLRSRRSARTLRAILTALVEVPLWLGRQDLPPAGAARPDIAAALTEAASLVETGRDLPRVVALLETAAEGAGTGQGDLFRVLSGLATAIRARLAFHDAEASPPRARTIVVLHRDWREGGHALLRTGGILLAVGVLWITSGWAGGAFVMLGTAVMLSLFSTFDSPAEMMVHVIKGQAAGVAAAFACRWLVWPQGDSTLDLVLMLMPFLLLGGMAFGHRRTAMMSMDLNMILLLLSQPRLPLSGTVDDWLLTGAGVVAAPVVALLGFRFILPVSAGHRLARLRLRLLHDLRDLAGDRRSAAREAVWRARLSHRVLVLIRVSDRLGRGADGVASGLAVLDTAEGILRLHDLRIHPATPPALRKRAEVALARLRQVDRDPQRAGRALRRVAEAVALAAPPAVSGPLPETIGRAADAVLLPGLSTGGEAQH